MTAALRRRIRDRLTRREHGAAAVFVVTLVGALALATGLVADGSAKIAAVRHAQSVAQEAARAAGQELNAAAITGTPSGADTRRAVAAGRAYLTAAGSGGDVSVSAGQLVVTAREPWDAHFLPGGGTATGRATVRIATAR